MKTRLMIVMAVLLLASVPLFAAYDAFLKIDSIPGESKDAAHHGWIDALSFSWGLSRANLASAAPRTPHSACAEHSEFTIVKPIDVATPKLAQAAMSGAPFPSLTLDVGGERHMFQNVVVSSIQKQRAMADGSAREAITFTFQRCATHEAAASSNNMLKYENKASYLKNVDQKVMPNGTLAFTGFAPGAVAIQDIHFNGQNQAIIVVCDVANGQLLPAVRRALQSKQQLPVLTVTAKDSNQDRPQESLSFNFTKVEVKNVSQAGRFTTLTLNFAGFQGPMAGFRDVSLK